MAVVYSLEGIHTTNAKRQKKPERLIVTEFKQTEFIKLSTEKKLKVQKGKFLSS